MNRIEEVSLIIYEGLGVYPDSGKSMRMARQINQLYEPQPELESDPEFIGEELLKEASQPDQCPECGGTGKDYRDGGFDSDFADCPSCKPDQSSRLLTPEEVKAVWSPHVLTPVLEAQRDLTASIKDAQQERLTKHYNKLIEILETDQIARIEALIEFIMIFLKDAGYGSKVADIGWMQFQEKYNIPAGELSLVEELEIALKANPTSEAEG